ncbi:MAG: alginate export family protein [Elusimicrobia bacterium]|nr:alginate export family protein [Elusimicrobiota bacterium]
MDLFSEIDLKTDSYQNLIYGANQNKQTYYLEDSRLGFVIKNIKLEKTNDSSMDVGIVLNSLSAGGISTKTVTGPQFSDAINRYSSVDGTPFVKEAYVKIYKFLKPGVTAVFGRQSFMLGQGIALSDNGAGIPGVKLEMENLLGRIKMDVFGFRIWKEPEFAKTYGAAVYYPAVEGLWNLYYVFEHDKTTGRELNYIAKSRLKKFAGIRYFLSHKRLNFDGELVLQDGSAVKTSGEKVKYKGHAFLIKGAWIQKLGKFGDSKMRLSFGKSSGNDSGAGGEDKAFFPSFGHKYKAIERDGFGDIIGATLYDIIKTTDTLNGLPEGSSGMYVVNLGMTLPYKKLLLAVDVFRFRVTKNIVSKAGNIGQETDFKISYPMSEHFKLTAVYSAFKPGDIFYGNPQATKLISFLANAKF